MPRHSAGFCLSDRPSCAEESQSVEFWTKPGVDGLLPTHNSRSATVEISDVISPQYLHSAGYSLHVIKQANTNIFLPC